MAMFTVKQLVQTKENDTIFSVAPADTVFRALQVMADKNVGAVLVLQDGELAGIFTERDYCRKIILMGRSSLNTQVQEIMTRKMITVSPEQTIEECMELMSQHHIRHLPVLDQGRLVGILSIGDVVKAIITAKQDTIENLEDYIMGRYIKR
jgi:CBS domain-containing protein